jgi:predicted ArsR family transcriptional regulator
MDGQLGHNGVVEIEQSADTAVLAPGTRANVLRSLLVDGPATAAVVADRLGLTPAAIRRHLDFLVDAGLVDASDRPPYGPTAPRGRGRPARVYALTDAGREAFPREYDVLASSVLGYLRAELGAEGVERFARERLSSMEQRYATVLDAVPAADRPTRLVALLTDDGYAASLDPTGPVGGAQICQHHCPVAHVAAEHPELCDAETEMFGRLLGTHVQRLATLAHGDALCTTHLPAASGVTADRTERRNLA